MGSQPLGAKWQRRIARATGLDIVRAWGHGGYTHGFVDRLHRHGSINATSLEWQLCTYEEQKGWPHYSTCCQFPDDGGYGSPWSEEVLAQCGLEPIIWSPRDEMERLRWRLGHAAKEQL